MASIPGSEPEIAGCRHGWAEIAGVRLHYVEMGSGPLVVLLHGFPEFWLTWRHQLIALAAAGYRAVAPDLRGYHFSDKPVGVAAYRPRALIDDVLGMIDHLGGDCHGLVGHDWGGVIAWLVAAFHPDRLRRCIILNAPHPRAFRRELLRPMQMLRSWYIGFFQIPWLPEWYLRRDDFAWLATALRRDAPGAFTEEDLHACRTALALPGVLTAALNYYRAAARYGGIDIGNLPVVEVPTLLLWGERDRYLGLRLTEIPPEWVPSLEVVRFPKASHWLEHDAATEVNEHILRFLQGGRAS